MSDPALRSVAPIRSAAVAVRSWGDPLVTWSLVLGSTHVCLRALLYQAGEWPWYPLHAAMTYTANPPFRHRVLFVWLANGIHAVFPSFHDPRCFQLSQLPVIFSMFVAIRALAERFVRRGLADLAPPLLTVMLIPTFSYWTFYDLGIVLFFTLSLLCLVSGRWLLQVLVVGIATLNHEISLLLIPLSILVGWEDLRRRSQLWLWVFAQLAMYFAVRAALFAALPAHTFYSVWRIQDNLTLPIRRPVAFLTTLAGTGWWLLPAGFGLKYAPPALRRAAWILPPLLLEIFVLGQFNQKEGARE